MHLSWRYHLIRRKIIHKLLLLIFLVTSIVAFSSSNLERPDREASPRLANATSHPATIKQSYIISLKQNNVDPHARGAWLNTVLSSNNHARRDLSPSANFDDLKLTWNETVFHGFSGTFSEAEIQTLRAQDEVKYIEPVYAGGMRLQYDAPWGVSRICQARTPMLAGSSLSRSNYGVFYHEHAGLGVDIYILDTGVRTSHSDFRGRAQFLKTFGSGRVGVDIHGHGTHIAGIAAGSKYGIARMANIIAIKFMGDDGTGFASDMISAIDLAVSSAASSGRPSIINIAVYTPSFQSIDNAIINGVNQDILFVVAAGNHRADAANYSPGRLGGAGGNRGVITVGSTTINDHFGPYSNFGPKVDVLAPGSDILSCGVSSDYASAIESGTSMAAAHVSGLAALIMGEVGKRSPRQLKKGIKGLSVPDIISGAPPGTPNLFAYTGALGW